MRPALQSGKVEPIVLIKADDPDRKPQLYACPKCGHCTSPRIFACSDDLAHEAAKQAAADCYTCRTHNVCTDCGAECEKLYTACRPCRLKKKLAAIEWVTIDENDPCFGFDGGDYYHSVEAARDDGAEIIHPATFTHYELEEFRVDEMILDDHHEDASITDLVGYDELIAAVRKFNEAQTSGSYYPDTKKAMRLKPEAAETPQ